MSLPRALTLEYHSSANTYAAGSSFDSLYPTSYMYNEDPYIGSTQQSRREYAAQGLQLVVTPAPAIKWLRQEGIAEVRKRVYMHAYIVSLSLFLSLSLSLSLSLP